MGEAGVAGDASTRASVKMCVWRVFGVGRDWADRPEEAGSRQIEQPAGPDQGDVFKLVVGEIPNYLLNAVREWRAQIPTMLDALVGGGDSPTSPEAQDRLIDDRMTSISLNDVHGGFPIWVTFEICRAIEADVDPAVRHRWLRSRETLQEAEAFGEQASTYLDGAVPLVQNALEELRLDQLMFSDRRPFLFCDGKAALTVPRLSGRGVGVAVQGNGWNELPFAAAEQVLGRLPSGTPQVSKYLTAPGAWFCAALRQQEDPLRRFLFGFLGLEVLVNKVAAGGAKSQLRKVLADKLAAEVEGLPFHELMWPLRDDEHSDRNLLFRFSCLASWISRPTAAADVKTFGRLQSARNDVAHGRVDAYRLEDLPGYECIELLRRYLCLVTEREARAGGFFT